MHLITLSSSSYSTDVNLSTTSNENSDNINGDELPKEISNNLNKRKTDDEVLNDIPTKRKTEYKICDAFDDINSYKEGGVKNAVLTNALLYMIAVDDLPLRLTEKRGFLKFTKVAAPMYKLPSRKTVTKLMDAKYKTLSLKVKIELENITSVSLTTDCWKETNTCKSYLGLTVHYLQSQDSTMTTINLGAFPLNENHTADYLGSQLELLCQQWGILKSSITAIVTDNAPNIVKAIKNYFASSHHLPCFAHTIQLIPEWAIKLTPNLSEIINKVKVIVAFCKHSTSMADELRRLQFFEGKTEGTLLKVIQQEDTRWNTTYYMIERFLEMAAWISSALFTVTSLSKPIMLLPVEIEILKDSMSLLKSIEQVTKELCSEDVTCSKVIPLVRCLTAALEKKNPQSEIGIILQQNLMKEMNNRFKKIEDSSLLTKATILDPRYKKIHFSLLAITGKVIRSIANEMNSNRDNSQTQSHHNINVDDNGNSDDLWYYHDSKATSQVTDRDEPGGLPAELRHYLSQSVVPRSKNPLKYWEEVKFTYPTLYPIARKYLSVTATSVPCERLFSKAGIIESDRRNRLNPERLSRLIFLSSLKEERWGFEG